VTTERYDWKAIVNGLNQYLRLRSIPIGPAPTKVDQF
jgi:hypothetical protein